MSALPGPDGPGAGGPGAGPASAGQGWRPYARAYLVRDLTAGPWPDPPPDLDPDGVAYVHDDLTVTAGSRSGGDVLLSEVTSEWARWCREQLAFTVPDADPPDGAGP